MLDIPYPLHLVAAIFRDLCLATIVSDAIVFTTFVLTVIDDICNSKICRKYDYIH